LAPCDIRVDAKWVPPLTDLDPEECRLSWKIEVNGPVKEAAIKSVFDWVEGECDLNIEAFGPAAESVAAAPAAAPAPAAPAAVDPVVEAAEPAVAAAPAATTTNSQAVASAASL